MTRSTAATLSLSLTVACFAAASTPPEPAAAAPSTDTCGSTVARLRSTQATIERVRRAPYPMRASDGLRALAAARVFLAPRGIAGCEDLARTRQGRLRIYGIDALLAAQYPRLATDVNGVDCRNLLRASVIDALARANVALEGTHEFAQPIGDAPTFVNAVRDDVRDAAHTLDLTLPAGISAASFQSSAAAAYDAAKLLADPTDCAAAAHGALASTSPAVRTSLFDAGI